MTEAGPGCPYHWTTVNGFHAHRCRYTAGHGRYHQCDGCAARVAVLNDSPEPPATRAAQSSPPDPRERDLSGAANHPRNPHDSVAAQPSSATHTQDDVDRAVEAALASAAKEQARKDAKRDEDSRALWKFAAGVIAFALLVWACAAIGDSSSKDDWDGIDPPCMVGTC